MKLGIVGLPNVGKSTLFNALTSTQNAQAANYLHVVRCFDDDNIIHVVEDVNKPESVDPIRDIDAIDLELILADLEVVSNRLGRQQKAAKTGNKTAAAEAAGKRTGNPHLCQDRGRYRRFQPGRKAGVPARDGH